MKEFNEDEQIIDVLNRVRLFIGSKPTIVEAGAHNGTDTIRLANYFINPIIFAFEPLDDQFILLCNKAKKFTNIFPTQAALAAENRIYKFHVSGGQSDASSSLLPPKEHLLIHPGVTFDNVIEVQGINLDKWCADNFVNKIDFMWLDMQGAEFEVLKSCPNILKTVRAIYTEVSLVENYSGAPIYEEYKKFLESNGFFVELEHLNWADGGNVLFLKK